MRHRLRAALSLVLMLAFWAVTTGSAVEEEIVAFNVETKKYHCLDCRWAIKCTRNCIEIPLSKAKRRKGVACKVCGGTCGS